MNHANWGTGPWSDEPDRIEFSSHGFECVLNRSAVGTWCGYVRLPPGHPCHGARYDDIDVDVHGGLTYAEPAASGGWWVGWDCAHYGDMMPASRAQDGIYRDTGWARAETERLAAQLQAMGE